MRLISPSQIKEIDTYCNDAANLPFNVLMEQPNKETMAAMLEAEPIARDPSVKRYSDVEEALRALKEWVNI